MLSTFIGDSRLDGGADLILGPHVPEMESRQASADSGAYAPIADIAPSSAMWRSSTMPWTDEDLAKLETHDAQVAGAAGDYGIVWRDPRPKMRRLHQPNEPARAS